MKLRKLIVKLHDLYKVHGGDIEVFDGEGYKLRDVEFDNESENYDPDWNLPEKFVLVHADK